MLIVRYFAVLESLQERGFQLGLKMTNQKFNISIYGHKNVESQNFLKPLFHANKRRRSSSAGQKRLLKVIRWKTPMAIYYWNFS
jgi:hypothetical protein